MATVPRNVQAVSGGSQALLRTLTSRHSSNIPHASRRWATLPSSSQAYRFYAKEASPPSALEQSRHGLPDSNLSWPIPNSANPYEIPTPYQIFRISKDEPYSKRRFYELVKLYHPDRAQFSIAKDGDSIEQLSNSARLERYRMVIAANELLSDPRRRKAYDKDGIGWSGKPDFGPSKPRWADVNNRWWSGFDDNVNNNNSPRHNATWEDWERWQMRNERTHGEQKETFTSNSTFVVIILVCAGFATVGESIRMAGLHKSTVQQVDDRHGLSSKELLQRRRDSQDFGDRSERSRRFLHIRGPVGNDYEIKPVGQEKEGSVFVPDDEVER